MVARPVSKASRPASPLAEASEPTAPDTDVVSALAQPRPSSPSTARTNAPWAALSPAPANLISNWEDKVEETLAAQAPTDVKARQMLEMFPRLPEPGQVEVATHLCNLVSDQDYAPMGQLLANPQLPPDVLDTLMADALNRPNSLKLPALLEVARTSEHPKAGDAKEVLHFFLGADYGDDWAKWQEQLQAWLKDNPD